MTPAPSPQQELAQVVCHQGHDNKLVTYRTPTVTFKENCMSRETIQPVEHTGEVEWAKAVYVTGQIAACKNER